jgi:hypothetical protein
MLREHYSLPSVVFNHYLLRRSESRLGGSTFVDRETSFGGSGHGTCGRRGRRLVGIGLDRPDSAGGVGNGPRLVSKLHAIGVDRTHLFRGGAAASL